MKGSNWVKLIREIFDLGGSEGEGGVAGLRNKDFEDDSWEGWPRYCEQK